MALPKLTSPPIQQPFNLPSGRPNPAWTKWFTLLHRWMGEGTGISPLDISGEAATAATSDGVTVIMNAGTPEGNQQASPGVHYEDTDTGIVYIKTDGDDTLGWAAIT